MVQALRCLYTIADVPLCLHSVTNNKGRITGTEVSKRLCSWVANLRDKLNGL